MSDFYALLARMKNIERWSLMRSNVKENVLEHTAVVAMISHALGEINNRIFGGNVNVDKLVTTALFHESSEVLTGDLPTPIKYYDEIINSAYKRLENLALDKLLGMLPSEFYSDYFNILKQDVSSYEYRLVKAADKLSAYVKCIEEIKSGNNEFCNAKLTIEKALPMDIPEVKYFCDNFLESFKKDLDDITL